MSKALDQLEELVEGKPGAPLAPLTKAEKLKAMRSMETSLNKQYKQKLVQRAGDRVGERMPSYSTGLMTVDEEVFGVGGVPKGRVIEIFGPESSGKTTIALQIIAQVQKDDGVALFVDAEHALDVNRAAQLGVDMDELELSQPDYGEQALEVVLAAIEARAADVIVVDSVSALVPLAELEGDMGDSHMGLQARMMSQAMRKLAGIANKNGVTVIFINQIREKIGVMFGSPETTSGGRALKFAATVRLDVRRVSKSDGGTLMEGETQIGHRIRVKGVKNKAAAPFRETIVTLYYDDRGFDTKDDTVQHAVNMGLVEAGAWYVYQGKKYRRGDLTEEPIFATLKESIEKARVEKAKKTEV